MSPLVFMQTPVLRDYGMLLGLQMDWRMLRNGAVLQRDELKVQAFFWHGSRLFMAADVVFASNVQQKP